MAKYHTGDIAYFIESRRFIREGKIIRDLGGRYQFRFVEGGGIQISESRLFPTEEAAQAELDRRRASERKPKDLRPVWERLAFFV